MDISYYTMHIWLGIAIKIYACIIYLGRNSFGGVFEVSLHDKALDACLGIELNGN